MTFKIQLEKIAPEQLFMGSVLLVNAGNYFYNIVLGRLLGPEAFAEVALLTTLVLILSFLGMTFQLSVAKFSGEREEGNWTHILQFFYKKSVFIGFGFALILLLSANYLKELFNTTSPWGFVLLGIGIPIYFVMSVNRGNYQGKQAYRTLSITYQTEMWSRLGITFLLLLTTTMSPTLAVAISILISFAFGLIPIQFKPGSLFRPSMISTVQRKVISKFMLLTAFYELTQIVINNGDVLLVKHLFEAGEAGWYASISLIGRVVYFATWMFVMLLLPAVIERKQNGEDTRPVLLKNLIYISILTITIVLSCYLMPEFIVKLMFGEAYLPAAPLLWKYALATSFFALANIFAYYYLSLDQYVPVLVSGVFGLAQLLWIGLGSETLEWVIGKQIIVMALLLVFQLAYFILRHRR